MRPGGRAIPHQLPSHVLGVASGSSAPLGFRLLLAGQTQGDAEGLWGRKRPAGCVLLRWGMCSVGLSLSSPGLSTAAVAEVRCVPCLQRGTCCIPQGCLRLPGWKASHRIRGEKRQTLIHTHSKPQEEDFKSVIFLRSLTRREKRNRWEGKRRKISQAIRSPELRSSGTGRRGLLLRLPAPQEQRTLPSSDGRVLPFCLRRRLTLILACGPWGGGQG